jgi:hypothetical protein
MTNGLQNNNESVIFNTQNREISAENTQGDSALVSSSSTPVRQAYVKRSAAADTAFFDALSLGYSVRDAAQAANYTRQVVYEWRANDPAFMARWKLSKGLALETVEEELMRRIFDGTEEPVFQKGVLVGHRRKFSDRLLIDWLKQGRKWINWLD